MGAGDGAGAPAAKRTRLIGEAEDAMESSAVNNDYLAHGSQDSTSPSRAPAPLQNNIALPQHSVAVPQNNIATTQNSPAVPQHNLATPQNNPTPPQAPPNVPYAIPQGATLANFHASQCSMLSYDEKTNQRVELFCWKCRANAPARQKKKYFDGAGGLIKHLTHAHNDETLPNGEAYKEVENKYDDVVRLFCMRVLSDVEAVRLANGGMVLRPAVPKPKVVLNPRGRETKRSALAEFEDGAEDVQSAEPGIEGRPVHAEKETTAATVDGQTASPLGGDTLIDLTGDTSDAEVEAVRSPSLPRPTPFALPRISPQPSASPKPPPTPQKKWPRLQDAHAHAFAPFHKTGTNDEELVVTCYNISFFGMRREVQHLLKSPNVVKYRKKWRLAACPIENCRANGSIAGSFFGTIEQYQNHVARTHGPVYKEKYAGDGEKLVNDVLREEIAIEQVKAVEKGELVLESRIWQGGA